MYPTLLAWRTLQARKNLTHVIVIAQRVTYGQ
jgi:hypothetical protein